jgi:sec-independent protein translocase protein TatC
MNDMEQKNIDLSRAPLLSHLLELRRRLLYILYVFLITFCISYGFSEQIYTFLTEPLYQAFRYGSHTAERKMIYTGLHEAFLTYLKLSFFTALFVCLPFALNQIWKFLAPGLYVFEQKAFRPLLVMTPVLFATGAAIAYYLVFPLAWKFFLSFETTALDGGVVVQLEARISEYLNLVIGMIMAFGISFELPMLLLLLAQLGFITADDLVKYRRHAVVIIFAIAAVITPPDLLSQILLGVPMYLLYELSIFWIRLQPLSSSLTPLSPSDK